MAQDRSTKIISMMKWIRNSRLSFKKPFPSLKRFRPVDIQEVSLLSKELSPLSKNIFPLSREGLTEDVAPLVVFDRALLLITAGRLGDSGDVVVGRVEARLPLSALRLFTTRIHQEDSIAAQRAIFGEIRFTLAGLVSDLIAASMYDKYSVGPSIRSTCTRCSFTMTNMIRVRSSFH